MSVDLRFAMVFKKNYEVPRYHSRVFVSNDHLVTVIASWCLLATNREQVSVAGPHSSQLSVRMALVVLHPVVSGFYCRYGIGGRNWRCSEVVQ